MVNMTNISTILEANEPQSVQGALSLEEHRALSFTAVLVLTSLFAFFTFSITGAIIVFCKKKNSVFALQKCEQESDIDYELDDLNSTEIEMSDDGLDDQTCSATKRSATYPDLKIVCNRNYRPHSVRDVGKYETEKQGGGTEIPRAHTFSFEKYEYTPIALSVPSLEGVFCYDSKITKIESVEDGNLTHHPLSSHTNGHFCPSSLFYINDHFFPHFALIKITIFTSSPLSLSYKNGHFSSSPLSLSHMYDDFFPHSSHSLSYE
ncbi:unnamed protein product [Acanthosepion pharaonis]|uniref:Uncharacterized protein n=1 Tax=Acanthosepion pharaonis TaxID=158019 RepID=A0A812E554_ACAPH|nr:unnamed protein product [Sepia pharaonis]